MPRALITGITGQDGQHLAEFLHSKGYETFGLVKGQANPKAELIAQELPYVELVERRPALIFLRSSRRSSTRSHTRCTTSPRSRSWRCRSSRRS